MKEGEGTPNPAENVVINTSCPQERLVNLLHTYGVLLITLSVGYYWTPTNTVGFLPATPAACILAVEYS